MKTNLLITALIALLLGIVLNELGFFDSGKLIRGLRNLGILTSDMVPPDFSVLPVAGQALWETVLMSFAGTMLGFLASLPLSILGTRNLFFQLFYRALPVSSPRGSNYTGAFMGDHLCHLIRPRSPGRDVWHRRLHGGVPGEDLL